MVLSDKDRTRDPISVAFFDQVALFSDFDHLFWLLGPGFAPCSSSAFYILEYSSKNVFKNAHCEFYTKFSCQKRMLLLQRLWVECKVCLSHAGGLRWQNLFLVIVQSATSKTAMVGCCKLSLYANKLVMSMRFVFGDDWKDVLEFSCIYRCTRV